MRADDLFRPVRIMRGQGGDDVAVCLEVAESDILAFALHERDRTQSARTANDLDAPAQVGQGGVVGNLSDGLVESARRIEQFFRPAIGCQSLQLGDKGAKNVNLSLFDLRRRESCDGRTQNDLRVLQLRQ